MLTVVRFGMSMLEGKGEENLIKFWFGRVCRKGGQGLISSTLSGR